MKVRIQDVRFSLLLLALVALVLGPLLASTTLGHSLAFGLASLAVLLLGTLALYDQPRARWAAGILAVLAGTAQVAQFVEGTWLPSQLHLAVLVAFLAFTTLAILRDVLQGEVVTWDKISGAVCAYLLIGVTWGLIHAWVRLRDPQAFRMPDGVETALPGEPMIYYSFTTLTTLGYGDITPLSHAARTLSWLEAAVGQVYLVVLVARLVSLHVTSAAPRD